jgi:para-aminobenzoate synthetase component I
MHPSNASSCTYTITEIQEFKSKMLSWMKQFNIFCFLDNHGYKLNHSTFDCLLAAGVKSDIETENLIELDIFLQKHQSWAFGHFSYELKNPIHHFSAGKKDRIGFPLLYFFIPATLILVKGNSVTIHSAAPQKIMDEILTCSADSIEFNKPSIQLQSEYSCKQYLDKISKLKEHIQRGDCYELNFCQEFFAEKVDVDPFALYCELMKVSPNPFSAFYGLNDKFVVCGSPERFLSRKGAKIYSQPIKGTSRRNLDDPAEDQTLKQHLLVSQKERSENVMVVDMVRSDLGKICTSVGVEELYGIYSYPQVHQMISTISGELKEPVTFSEIISATFPMGSMTGAPKHRVMQLIDLYEESGRGLFSGSVGYITPSGDFDFNVVIRSIMYNSTENYLSYKVGSGITIYCEAEKEWEECLLKAEAIKKVLIN